MSAVSRSACTCEGAQAEWQVTKTHRAVDLVEALTVFTDLVPPADVLQRRPVQVLREDDEGGVRAQMPSTTETPSCGTGLEVAARTWCTNVVCMWCKPAIDLLQSKSSQLYFNSSLLFLANNAV